MSCGDDDDGAAAADAAQTADAPQAVADAAPLPPDAEPPDAGPLMTDQCPTSYGPTGISSTFAIAEAGVGFDLNGDSSIDNAIGSTAVRGVVNANFDSSLADGSLRSLVEVRDLDSLAADDADVTLAIFGGIDSDSPRNLADDFAGDEAFYFSHEWVNSLTCEPRAAASATYTSGVMRAQNASIQFFVAAFDGFLDVQRATIEAAVVADTAGIKTVAGTPAVIGGAIPTCSLQNGDAMGFGANALHALVQFFKLQPDIDLDGDGLETIETQSLVIVSCTDGDGTVIESETCGCDPRMRDGFSVTFTTDLVGATLLGPAPTP